MKISYDQFACWEVPNKITFMEDWFVEENNIENISERELKMFIRNVLENEENGYVKILTIETLIFLTNLNKIRKGSTIDILLDIEDEEDSFVLITMLRYLTIFQDEHDDIIEKLERLKGHENPEVSSEAYYRLGLINFLDCNASIEKDQFFNLLNESMVLFNYARGQIENRTDAEYYYHVCRFLESFFITNEKQMNDSFDCLFKTSSSRQAFHYNENFLVTEYKINKIFLNLKYIYDSTKGHDGWIDFYNEFRQLSIYHYEILDISLSGNEFQKNLLSRVKSQVNDNIAKSLYLKNFSYYEARINNAVTAYSSDQTLKNFLNYLLELIRKDEKKKDNDSIIEVCAKIDNVIQGSNQKSNIMELVQTFKTTHNIENLDDILEIITKYTETKYASNFEFITGFDVGEEIFKRLYKSINEAMSNYDNEKLQIFMRIIEEIIRYLILTVRNKRDDVFGFLYTEKHGGKGSRASERDLQDSLLKHFHYSKIAYGAKEEINNFADGGRIDIVYNINNYIFPIELKKTKEKISQESIQKKYLEQVHSYIYSYQQLGVFVLLDLNEKDKPVNDVRDLVYLEHLEPLYDLKNKYPDNIVVVIIPGNKPLPSDKSTYR